MTRIHSTESKVDIVHRWRRCTVCPHRFRTLAPPSDSKNESIYTGPGHYPAGPKHSNAVFTADNIRAIREEHAAGRTFTALSLKYGVYPYTIQKICLRKSYKHVA
jgi:hypothetical protein